MDQLYESLIGILAAHDPKEGDLSFRAEGTFQAIEALADSGHVEALVWVQRLGSAIIDTCGRYNQTETIDRGVDPKPWPTNRYALKALAALGVKKPSPKPSPRKEAA